jgi:hypothetical protein
MLARGAFVVTVLTLIFTALLWAETSKWLPLWVSVMTQHGTLVQLTLLSVLAVIGAWAILKLQSRLTKLESRLTKLVTRFESHDHNDLEWIARSALRQKP